jgi:hypothetical protein
MARSEARKNVEKLRNIVAASNFLVSDWSPDTETGTNDRDNMASLYAFCAANKCELIYASEGHTLLDGAAIQVNAPITWMGKGFRDLDNARTTDCPDAGTWLIMGPNSTGSMFEVTNNAAKRCGWVDTAIYQMGHSAPGTGWTPADRDWVFDCTNTQGGVRFERVHFHNVARGINFDFCVRPEFEQITGQFFVRGISMDRVFDIGRCVGLRAWTYWSEQNDVLAYTQANSITLTLLRVDGLWLDELFSFGTAQALYCGPGAYPGTEGGSARAIFIGGVYADFCGRAVVADTTNVELQIGAIYHLGQAWPASPAADLAGAGAVDIASGSNSLIQVGHIRSNVAPSATVRNAGAGTGNRVWVGSAIFQNYDYDETGSGAVSTSAGNAVNFSMPPLHTNKLGGSKLTSSVAGAVGVSVEQIYPAGAVNYIRTAAASTGLPAIVEAIGETNVDLYLRGTGAGLVRFGVKTAAGDAASDGYVTIKDAAGNTIKLATRA